MQLNWHNLIFHRYECRLISEVVVVIVVVEVVVVKVVRVIVSVVDICSVIIYETNLHIY